MNDFFSADALWGNRYVLPPADRLFDSRGNEVTGMVIPSNMPIVRVMQRLVAQLTTTSNLAAFATPLPSSLCAGAG
jgi:hypothetical protein